ncbi:MULTISPECIES: zinc ribbon domain-containing protein [Halobacteriaceae]|uniref:Zinc-ribbon domain-containing protein n=1 Tax=Halanaeroarchaeum sulfurireducens TaxID=1604004 RepID=A0A0F7PHF2_9EURY|nr:MULTISPECIES: hypothetical protein [Halobacteriaceae]AKH98653.1 hypothetical protein HLASF_3027 [Halanaeroarchaeum sulfurireducens]ALG83096.1 hypothetical protein HLASA_3028 [Halanaeroarchaeum sulfurireducens]MDR5657856.1 hypothetical protein [Halodesulfurarchaeum sp. HSR-GB]
MTATIVDGLKQLVGRGRDTVMYECRHCGTTVDHDADRCPRCDATAIARYHV